MTASDYFLLITPKVLAGRGPSTHEDTIERSSPSALYAKCNTADILNRPHLDYHKVDPDFGGLELYEDQRRDCFKVQNLKHSSISDLPVDTVISILEKEFKPDL